MAVAAAEWRDSRERELPRHLSVPWAVLSSLCVRLVEVPDSHPRLELIYRGPLISYDPLFVRLTERRQGSTRTQTRVEQLTRLPDAAWCRIELAPGPPLCEAMLAFFTRLSGGGEIWDTAGSASGYYSFDALKGKLRRR